MTIYTLFAQIPREGLVFLGNYKSFDKAETKAHECLLEYSLILDPCCIGYEFSLSTDEFDANKAIVILNVRWRRFSGEEITTHYSVANIITNQVIS